MSRMKVYHGFLLLALLGMAATTGCQTLAFHERGRLQDTIMTFDESAGEVHWVQKVRYSREGSIGGIGATAGGGCGCY